jgi:hypothetical protein
MYVTRDLPPALPLLVVATCRVSFFSTLLLANGDTVSFLPSPERKRRRGGGGKGDT